MPFSMQSRTWSSFQPFENVRSMARLQRLRTKNNHSIRLVPANVEFCRATRISRIALHICNTTRAVCVFPLWHLQDEHHVLLGVLDAWLSLTEKFILAWVVIPRKRLYSSSGIIRIASSSEPFDAIREIHLFNWTPHYTVQWSGCEVQKSLTGFQLPQ